MRQFYPYGIVTKDDEAAFDRWLAVYRRRYVPRARCLHWLKAGRCAVQICRAGHRSQEWMDHVSGYVDEETGERILLAQPYHFTDFASLTQVCEGFGLTATVDGHGWYGHSTTTISLRASHPCAPSRSPVKP
jgi:hypothetical protein